MAEQCAECGKEIDLEENGYMWQQTYSGNPPDSPSSMHYLCEECLEDGYSFAVLPGILPSYSVGRAYPKKGKEGLNEMESDEDD